MKAESNPKVLIADDRHIIADTLVTILNHSGFEARAAYCGETAVELAREFQPDVLIIDVVMLAMSGIDAAIEVQSMLPSCKILLFSGQAATADLLQKARTEGHVFEILVKPIDPKELIAKLRDILLTMP
jgi:CheY-like chemotaxis protein